MGGARIPSFEVSVHRTNTSCSLALFVCVPVGLGRAQIMDNGDVMERMVPTTKPVFRVTYSPSAPRQLTVLVTRKTSGITRLPLTSIHENRMFRFMFLIKRTYRTAGLSTQVRILRPRRVLLYGVVDITGAGLLHSFTASQLHSLTASQPHSLTASQLYSLKASQPRSFTASQPHSLTASQPHSLIASQPHSLTAS